MKTEKEIVVKRDELDDHRGDENVDFRSYESMILALEWVLEETEDL